MGTPLSYVNSPLHVRLCGTLRDMSQRMSKLYPLVVSFKYDMLS